MNLAAKVREHFEKRRRVLERSLAQAQTARSEAPKPTESHSDTTMSEKEKLVTALKLDLGRLNGGMKKLEGLKLECLELENRMKVILVPEGMGGGEIEGVQLVSENAPLALKVKSGEVRVSKME